jgi:hypothetical protein
VEDFLAALSFPPHLDVVPTVKEPRRMVVGTCVPTEGLETIGVPVVHDETPPWPGPMALTSSRD